METIAAITRYCRYQERCHSEVRNKLYELGCNTRLVEETIADLVTQNLLNEERFARAFARGRFRMKYWGREKIKQELKLRKISDYCIKKGLSEIDLEEYDLILNKLLDKKIKELSPQKNQSILYFKVFRYIIQKGYERDIVIELLNDKIKNKNK